MQVLKRVLNLALICIAMNKFPKAQPPNKNLNTCSTKQMEIPRTKNSYQEPDDKKTCIKMLI